jgi:hypothetical protein
VVTAKDLGLPLIVIAKALLAPLYEAVTVTQPPAEETAVAVNEVLEVP